MVDLMQIPPLMYLRPIRAQAHEGPGGPQGASPQGSAQKSPGGPQGPGPQGPGTQGPCPQGPRSIIEDKNIQGIRCNIHAYIRCCVIHTYIT